MALIRQGEKQGWSIEMLAEALDISPESLVRWLDRRENQLENKKQGRPLVIGDKARGLIRDCYTGHYGQWGPKVLTAWCRREGIGDWSAGTISKVIVDLREKNEVEPPPVRFEITGSNVMWSEDGTGFRQDGKKQELLVVQDEHSRLKLNWELAPGPATANDVLKYLEWSFKKYGAPLVLKHDGAGIFHTPEVRQLLEKYMVLDLTSPAGHPGYNGKQERSMRDIKSYERAMRKNGRKGTLRSRLHVIMKDLNEDRPRPVLAGRTAREAYNEGMSPLPERRLFIAAVETREKELLRIAASRGDVRKARRRAIEQTLLSYGLMEIEGDVSHSFLAEVGTN